MASDGNLHISIGGMLDDDVSSTACSTRSTNTTVVMDRVPTRRLTVLESSGSGEMENGIFIHSLLLATFSSVCVERREEKKTRKIDFHPNEEVLFVFFSGREV